MTGNQTRAFSSSLEEARQEAATLCRLQTDRIAFPLQTHSDIVKWVSHSGIFADADGLITQSAKVVLSLQVADCVPVFIYDRRKNTRGLIHAGWRGTTGSITARAINYFIDKGTDVHDLIVYLGPAICRDHYEVGAEVAQLFHKSSLKKSSSRFYADLRSELTLKLLELGLPANNIHVSDLCTYEEPKCCSYRRDGKTAGRMFAFMEDA